MGNENKRIEQIKKGLNELQKKVLMVKKSKINKKPEKFIKLKNWKQFRANVNKGDADNVR